MSREDTIEKMDLKAKMLRQFIEYARRDGNNKAREHLEKQLNEVVRRKMLAIAQREVERGQPLPTIPMPKEKPEPVVVHMKSARARGRRG